MLSIAILSILGIWLVLCGYMYIFQARYVYFPDSHLIASPADIGLSFQELYLTTADNIRIHGWFIPHVDAQHTLLFLHGNAGNISHRLQALQTYHELGVSVLAIDYRGYGLSEGQADEAGTYADAQAAWTYLITERQLSAEQIIIAGRSLGGGVATWLARHFTPAALILESSFTSLTDVAARVYPYLPVKWLSRIHYPNLQRIADVQAPVLIIHSQDDELVPFEQGEQLFHAARLPKAFLPITGSHNTGFTDSHALYVNGIQAFFQKHLDYRRTTASTPAQKPEKL